VSEYTDELRSVIRKLHGVDSKHVESVPVKEEFQGRTVWEGFVEVFQLFGHPKAMNAFAWAHETNEGKKRHVTVLQMHPVVSAADAVRAVIVQEFRNLEPAE